MKEKQIKRVLEAKFQDWVDSIEDLGVAKIVTDEAIITGGAIASLMMNEKPNDYDVYFKTKKAAREVAEYYCHRFNERNGAITTGVGQNTRAVVIDGDDIRTEGTTIYVDDPNLVDVLGRSVFEVGSSDADGFSGMTRTIAGIPPGRLKVYIQSDGVAGDIPEGDEGIDIAQVLDDAEGLTQEEKYGPYEPVFLSTNAISLTGGIQIVIRFYGEISDIHENYDFDHTKGGWDPKRDELIIEKPVYEAVLNKTLIYSGSKYPLCSLFRLRKFIGRGWKINAGQMLRIGFQISDLNLSDIDTLEDQLIGVDSFYFSRLVHILRKKQESGELNDPKGYAMTLIERIF